MVKPPGPNDTASARRYLSMCATGVRSSSGDASRHDCSAEAMHKPQKQHVKVASRFNLHSMRVTCQALMQYLHLFVAQEAGHSVQMYFSPLLTTKKEKIRLACETTIKGGTPMRRDHPLLSFLLGRV